MAEVVSLFEAVRPASVEVSVELEPGLGVQADPHQLGQVLWNLVLNASQAMPDGGRLRIEARALSDAGLRRTLCGDMDAGMNKTRSKPQLSRQYSAKSKCP